MAPTLVQSKSATGTSGTTLTVTLTSATTAGNCLIVCVSAQNGTSNPTVSGITLGGSAGNFAAANTANSNSGINTVIWADPNCAGGQTSVVISFTGSSGPTPCTAAWAMEWSGLVTSSVVDAHPAGSDAAGSSWSSGSTGTLAQASELAVGVVGAWQTSGTVTTPGSPWTELAQAGTISTVLLGAGYQVVSSTAALTYNGTASTSMFYGTCIATFKAVAGTSYPGTAALSGAGTLTGAAVFAGTAALSGIGTLTGSATVMLTRGQGVAALTGSGTLTGTGSGFFTQVAALTGTGTLAATWIGTLIQPPATLAGQGTLNLSGLILGFTGPLAGNGTLSILQATGGLVFASPGAGVPYAYPLSSQVMVAPPGTQAWRPLGSVGAVTALTYSYTCPGGADKMTCTVMAPAAYRTQLFNPGWAVKITRGGHQIWSGKLDEPQPSSSGWTLTAVGAGNRGTDFTAVYTSTWPSGEPDQAINNAISRGLPWINPGIGTPSGAWFGQAPDSASQTITQLLNLICTRGKLTWYVNSQPGGIPGDDLAVFPLPTTVNRLLVCTDPVARTLGGDINTIWIRYQSSADDATSGTTAAYGTTSAASAASVTAHGVIETFIDLSSAGIMTQTTAQNVAQSVLAIYQRASFAGPFTARYGQLTTTGGVPIDPGTDQAGTVVKLILTDFAFGGEVTPQFPISFIVGGYEWDDLAQTATITPYQTLNQSLSGLLSLENTELTPITVA